MDTPPPDTLSKPLVDLPITDANPWSSAPNPTAETAHPDEDYPDEESTRLEEKDRRDVLDAFDPLADKEEQGAAEAWADAEGHPPPPVPPKSEPDSSSATPSTSSQSDPPPKTGASTPTNGFPSLASLARSLALPALPALPKNMNISLVSGTGASGKRVARPRPQSLDTATLMATPVHAGSFATQQDPSRQQTAAGLLEAEAEASARGSPKARVAEVPGLLGDGGAAADGQESESSAMPRTRERSGDKDPPFDFQKFLDQMKTKSAEPVARYLRSFLSNFAKRTFTVADQVKLINDFLNFISQKMHDAEVWKNGSDAEFDNAMEGMEKLVMNRLYDYTFTPQVARAVPPRAITTDDLERDRVLAQRISLFGWIEPRHLDVPVGEGTNGFLMFAEQELIKINHYKAPRDKLICILNCCKVIFGLIRHLNSEESADTFVPILIFVVLKANPENLLSNVEFINRFRSPAKLQSEAGYYLSSLMGAVSFIETMDHTSLSNITQQEFESNVEAAIQNLPSSRSHSPRLTSSSSSSSRSISPSHPQLIFPTPSTPMRPPANPIPVPTGSPPPPSQPPSIHAGEEPATPLSLPALDARKLLQRTGDSLSKPLSAIGRIFSEALDGAEEVLTAQFTPPHTPAPAPPPTGPPAAPIPYQPRVRRISPAPSPVGSLSLAHSPAGSLSLPYADTPTRRGPASRAGTPGASVDIDIPGLQAEIDAAHVRAADAARGTLWQIFPSVDREIVDWVLEANEGDLGKSIEALLDMSVGD
ncbi:hypothetical protein FA95DRAFT_1548395 [Auriscalpium vulgare]|uniref:Uncharacterized protein n=1 Tax=Auriscalpium vulgare TaxID=40419 RepID=A0ACB8RC68_9AGAM|nr:hypothetical protein FA95DRAFT_1548395 [Auriscalpium vulgare]